MRNRTITFAESPLALLLRVINYILGLAELLLGLRFFLRFIGANPRNVFAAYTYELSSVLLVPFRSIIPSTVVEGSSFEWSTLFAMAIYALAAYLLIQLILLFVPHADIVETTTETVDIDTLSDV